MYTNIYILVYIYIYIYIYIIDCNTHEDVSPRGIIYIARTILIISSEIP